MTHDNRLWVLMSRHLSGEASPDEEKELQELLAQSPGRQYLHEILFSYFQTLPANTAVRSNDMPALDERFRKMMDSSADLPQLRHPRLPARRKWMTAAAIAAGLLLLWGGYHVLSARHVPSAAIPHNEEVMARPGTRTKLLLPDGTQVWLNSNSRLK